MTTFPPYYFNDTAHVQAKLNTDQTKVEILLFNGERLYYSFTIQEASSEQNLPSPFILGSCALIDGVVTVFYPVAAGTGSVRLVCTVVQEGEPDKAQAVNASIASWQSL